MGLAIGAALVGRKPVLSMLGDGGIGACGMDIETAVRWKCPIIFVVNNNNGLQVGHSPILFGKLAVATGDPMLDLPLTLPGIRYDKMFEPLGCHVEHVERTEQIFPALERAFGSGKTAVINCIVNPEIWHPLSQALGMQVCWTFMDWDELSEKAQKMIENIPMARQIFWPESLPQG